MAIPETQLDTWSHQGSVTQSKDTYKIIKNALEDAESAYAGMKPEVFLQGSYCNDTNIYSESDVDIVIQLDTCFQKDLEELSLEQKNAFKAAHSDATYTHVEFKKDVLKHLEKRFGSSVKPGDKAIRITESGGRRNADVLITIQYRRYHRFITLDNQEYDLGICFYDSANTQIANYPKQHSKNCTTKHQSTSSWFKPMVRIFKNARVKLEDDGELAKGVAPSYYIEGLLYNVPDQYFGGTYQRTFENCLDFIRGADRSAFVCANKQYYLLRDGSKVTWSDSNCDKFLKAVGDLWENW